MGVHEFEDVSVQDWIDLREEKKETKERKDALGSAHQETGSSPSSTVAPNAARADLHEQKSGL